MVNLEQAFFFVLSFCLFESESWPRMNKSAWWIFTQLFFCGGEFWPNCFTKEVNWWWILTQQFCCKGEQRWRFEVGRFKMPFDGCLATWHLAKMRCRGTVAPDSRSQGHEFELHVNMRVLSLSKALYSNLPLLTQVYKWAQAQAGKVTDLLCTEDWRTSHSNIIIW